ncbi:hypothetical protein AM500_12000 [Bacillus sp. FJAT-18017]|uniref:hypothetical protein n=1 Tax=Bacillus sp. FJAT-18017 TaxID=1705566 RepID=UPI0006AE5B92|nr:hypothetical protein [Bacillus sp. FJAT-18017]ALC90428.1 hypothetical protein AM500_12000 [Bacillus sp. FJAT-18017]
MDKVTHISFILYHSSEDPDVRSKALDLLNGETSLHEMRKEAGMLHLLEAAEAIVKRQKANKDDIQRFVEEYLLVEA